MRGSTYMLLPITCLHWNTDKFSLQYQHFCSIGLCKKVTLVFLTVFPTARRSKCTASNTANWMNTYEVYIFQSNYKKANFCNNGSQKLQPRAQIIRNPLFSKTHVALQSLSLQCFNTDPSCCENKSLIFC